MFSENVVMIEVNTCGGKRGGQSDEANPLEGWERILSRVQGGIFRLLLRRDTRFSLCESSRSLPLNTNARDLLLISETNIS